MLLLLPLYRWGTRAQEGENDIWACVYSWCDDAMMIVPDAIRVPWMPGRHEVLTLCVRELNFKDSELPVFKGRGKSSQAEKLVWTQLWSLLWLAGSVAWVYWAAVGKTREVGTGCGDITLEGEPGPDGKQHCLVLEESDTTLCMTGTLWRVFWKRETWSDQRQGEFLGK